MSWSTYSPEGESVALLLSCSPPVPGRLDPGLRFLMKKNRPLVHPYGFVFSITT